MNDLAVSAVAASSLALVILGFAALVGRRHESESPPRWQWALLLVAGLSGLGFAVALLPVSMAELVLEIVAPLGVAAVAILVLIDRQAAAQDTKLWPFQLIAVGGVLFALLAIGQRL